MTSQIIQLQPGQTAMFGYGSLLLQRSMEKTLGKPYNRPRAQAWLAGWRRSWDVLMPNDNFYELLNGGGEFVPQNIIYLNVRPSLGDSVNGLVYVVDAEELEGFDRREWIYDRQTITSALRGVTIAGGEAYVYVAKSQWLVPKGCTRDYAAVRQTYIDIVTEGLESLGPEFRSGYEHSTDTVPFHLVFADERR
jgi:hypothetical protein